MFKEGEMKEEVGAVKSIGPPARALTIFHLINNPKKSFF